MAKITTNTASLDEMIKSGSTPAKDAEATTKTDTTPKDETVEADTLIDQSKTVLEQKEQLETQAKQIADLTKAISDLTKSMTKNTATVDLEALKQEMQQLKIAHPLTKTHEKKGLITRQSQSLITIAHNNYKKLSDEGKLITIPWLPAYGSKNPGGIDVMINFRRIVIRPGQTIQVHPADAYLIKQYLGALPAAEQHHMLRLKTADQLTTIATKLRRENQFGIAVGEPSNEPIIKE